MLITNGVDKGGGVPPPTILPGLEGLGNFPIRSQFRHRQVGVLTPHKIAPQHPRLGGVVDLTSDQALAPGAAVGQHRGAVGSVPESAVADKDFQGGLHGAIRPILPGDLTSAAAVKAHAVGDVPVVTEATRAVALAAGASGEGVSCHGFFPDCSAILPCRGRHP